MASKQVRKPQQQRNQQPRATSKVINPPLKDRSFSNPWSFLELIDAPQWVDLSTEGSSMGKEGFYDPWFDRSHKHHVKSLAGLNSNMSWLRLGKSGLGTRCQRVLSKPAEKKSAGHQQKSCNKESQSQGQVTGSRFHKKEQDFNSTERGCNSHRLFGSGKMGCSFSGCSSTSENELSGSFKKRSLCSDRSSVSSSLQVFSVELEKSSSNVQRGSLDANLSEDFHDVPSSHSSGTQKSRNSSTASYCPPMAAYSSEVGVTTRTKPSEFGVSTVAKLQFACETDRQFCGHSVTFSESVSSSTSEGQGGKVSARALEEGTRKISEPKVDGYYDQLSSGAASSTLNENSLCYRQMANGALNSGIKAGRHRLGMRVSQAGPLPRKQLYIGKENACPEENLLRVKGGPSCAKAPLGLASSKTANARTVGLSLGGGFHASAVKKKEGPQCALNVRPWKGGVSQNLYSCYASSTGNHRKRSESNQLPVLYEKSSNSERELAALVAQHNQKIRSLQRQTCRKGLR